jgi:methylenetetrahydrofolate dehydrogenase (NADP+)/methenyltetrahydrofolate cyclohydrolase
VHEVTGVAARIIDGKAVAAQIRAEVAERVRALTAEGRTPGLAAVLVGDDPASRIYVTAKQKDCAEVGIASERVELPADTRQERLLEQIARLNADPAVSGIIVQLPVPDHIDELTVQMAIEPSKDVDGLHPVNVGLMVRGVPAFLPATPAGIVELLVRSGIPTVGADVVVVGRGGLVGMPLSIMLAQKSPRGNATVTLCHTGTRDLASHTHRADILVVAAGRIATVTADMVKPGGTVIDVGTNRGPDGKLVGDVAFAEVAEVAGAITPVPGGVGPMTRAMLLVNTVAAVERAPAQ